MSVSFPYPKNQGSLDLSNGTAFDLLALIGYKATENAGKMKIVTAERGINKGRKTLWERTRPFYNKSFKEGLTQEDAKELLNLTVMLDHLWDLHDVIVAHKEAGSTTLSWY